MCRFIEKKIFKNVFLRISVLVNLCQVKDTNNSEQKNLDFLLKIDLFTGLRRCQNWVTWNYIYVLSLWINSKNVGRYLEFLMQMLNAPNFQLSRIHSPVTGTEIFFLFFSYLSWSYLLKNIKDQTWKRKKSQCINKEKETISICHICQRIEFLLYVSSDTKPSFCFLLQMLNQGPGLDYVCLNHRLGSESNGITGCKVSHDFLVEFQHVRHLL